MTRNVKTKILITIIFLGISAITVFVSDYVASYYEKLGKVVPRWIYYTLFGVLGFTYLKFIEVFSTGKDNNNDNIQKR